MLDVNIQRIKEIQTIPEQTWFKVLPSDWSSNKSL